MTEPLLYEISRPGRRGCRLPEPDVPRAKLPAGFLRDDLPLPEVSEMDLVRHYVHLSQLNHAVDTGFYPLGSCTMKYNPRVNEAICRLPGFTQLHPLQPSDTVQGALVLLYELQEFLGEISGFPGISLQPAAGAHGEMTGVLIMRKALYDRGETQRNVILVPDSAHGTNPATTTMSGLKVVEIASDAAGNVDLDALRVHLSDQVVGLMLTNPNTLGLFDEQVLEVTRLVHEAGGLVYGDGANLNALLGICKPADLGFDVMHFNLHKTFSTPHGGGGPGAGPICVTEELAAFLPGPRINVAGDGSFTLGKVPGPDGLAIHSYFGNVGVSLRALAYILRNGGDGLTRASECAVLNANYLLARLQDILPVDNAEGCMHEFVASGTRWKDEFGIRTLDVAKRMLDYGVHAPTIYFPLIVEEAMMVEPTETEPRESLDLFVDIMRAIYREAGEDPELLKGAPHTTPVGRMDEARAARQPDLRWLGPCNC